MKGMDYTVLTTKEQAKALKQAGYNFVCRYLVPESMAWKRLTKTEVEILSNEGLLIGSVYEASADGAKKGTIQGTNDGKNALAEAKIVGQPIGSCIYFAVDYDVPLSDYNAIESYLKAAQLQITGYNVGVYGSYTICEEMFKRGIKYCWQTYAWSKGKKSTHTNIYQYKNGIVDCGINGDANESFGNEGFWNLDKEVNEDMYIQLNDKNEKVKFIQEVLNNLSYNCGTADGIYGKGTLTGVNQFKTKYGLEQNGIVDNDVLVKIIDEYMSIANDSNNKVKIINDKLNSVKEIVNK